MCSSHVKDFFLIGEMLSVAMISPQTELVGVWRIVGAALRMGGDDITTYRTG